MDIMVVLGTWVGLGWMAAAYSLAEDRSKGNDWAADDTAVVIIVAFTAAAIAGPFTWIAALVKMGDD